VTISDLGQYASEDFHAQALFVGAWIDFYNARRPHSSLSDLNPDKAYCGQPGSPVLQDKNTEAA
jgi:hypothetical protein